MVNLMADYWLGLGPVLTLNHLNQIQSYLHLEMLDFHELLVLNFVVLDSISNGKTLELSSDW